MMRRSGFLAALLIGFAFLCGSTRAAERTVVVVMFDGFAPAMADATPTPNLDRIKREGAWSRHLVPEFPSLSMINHTTFETGCRPWRHGIISNIFYDPQKGRYAEDPDGDWRTGCETMWEAAERQGVKSAVFNFVNRWSTSHGSLATYTNAPVPWSQHESDETILNRALAQLRNNRADHPRLIALYFPIPDEIAHYNGTTAPKTLEAVRRCDAIVGRLMAAIKALPPDREGTLIIGTDHGMMDIGPLVNLGRIMNANDIHAKQASDGATAFLYLNKGESIERVQKALSQYAYAFGVYRKGHYPAFSHLGDGPRTGDLLLVAHPPYWIEGEEQFPAYAKWLGVTHIWPSTFVPPFGGLKATHGYDPHIVQMHGIFYAWGAGVAKGKEIPRLDMIDVHPTVMALLGVQPGQPQDGHAVDLH